MKWLPKLLIVVGLIPAAIAGLAVWQRIAATEDEFSYRVEATFDENGKPVVGSNVVHISVRRNIPCVGICGYTISVQGQAIPVKFSNGKYVFALLGVADHSFRAGKMPFQAFTTRSPYTKISELPREPLNVPPEYVPTIIYFADMADPESAVIANQDNLQTLVGENVHLMNVSVKLTDDPVSTGIDILLPWVKKQEVVQKSNENISTSHSFYPETNNKSKPLKADYPRFLERNDW
ncbi:hypothetical protein QA648_28170 (plasmid) [Rhizobium sp. CB3171]|uniref:hypothetical protein n=1 Tax=Rhizobium sp. CB3171 TaxID=3039157 RepID=UPI0024B1CD4C|nr:hypothetical protein [Rhizobium sp. CB3171]WFU04648.1 hypothetical protein QA648_28170 [Rhizobium sp. CB3171]